MWGADEFATPNLGGPCEVVDHDVTYEMPARGRLTGEELTFEGASVHVLRTRCERRRYPYFPDRFSGRIDRELGLYDAVDNDGAGAIDLLVHFHRVRCTP